MLLGKTTHLLERFPLNYLLSKETVSYSRLNLSDFYFQALGD